MKTILKGRKTADVKLLLDWASCQLSRKDDYACDVKFKAGICHFAEKLLHSTGNYSGFMFANSNDSECDTLGYYTRIYF